MGIVTGVDGKARVDVKVRVVVRNGVTDGCDVAFGECSIPISSVKSQEVMDENIKLKTKMINL